MRRRRPGAPVAVALLVAVLCAASGGPVAAQSSPGGPGTGTQDPASLTAVLGVAPLALPEITVPAATPAGAVAVVRVRMRNDLPRELATTSVTVSGAGAPVTATGPRLAPGASAVVDVPVLVCAAGQLPVLVTGAGVDGDTVRVSPTKTAVLAVGAGPGCTPPRVRPDMVVSDARTIATTGGVVDLAVSAGRLAEVRTVSDGALPAPPAGWTFPYGALSFVIEGLDPGATVSVDLAAPQRVTGYAKLLAGAWTLLPSSVTGESIVVRLTDGGLGDADGRADGRIVDPVAPAIEAAEGSVAPGDAGVVRPASGAATGGAASPVVRSAAEVAGVADERRPLASSGEAAAAPSNAADTAPGRSAGAVAEPVVSRGRWSSAGWIVLVLAVVVGIAVALGVGAVGPRRRAHGS